MRRLTQVIQAGWPESRGDLPLNLQPYFSFREELSVQDGLIFKGERIVVPNTEGLRSKVLGLLHKSHTGVQGCLRRAREVVYWPGMTKDMEQWIGSCDACQTHQASQAKEPMISHPIPERPWQYLAGDSMEVSGQSYLVLVDYYSDFFEIDRVELKTAHEIIYQLKGHFARHDFPDRLVTDNGPPFNSHKFTHFAETWGFEHITSSPTYAQSNGKAENAVKQAKLLILKAQESKTDPYLALLELRNIPSESMKTSPAQRLFSRRTQTQLPTAKTLLKPQTCTEVTDKLYKKKEKQAKYYNRDVTELSTLKPGQTIRVQMGKKWVKAKVEEQVDIRSYRLRTEDGKQYRRNRKHLRTTQENCPNNQPTMRNTIQGTEYFDA